ncbi:hypothetical protein Gotur_006306 [Gossypium turneri]
MPRRRLRDLSIIKILQIRKKQIVNNRLLFDLRKFRIQLTNLQKFKLKVVGGAKLEDVRY